MLAVFAQTATRIGSPLLGFIIPALIFGLSFFIAFYLYRHFTKQIEEQKNEQGD